MVQAVIRETKAAFRLPDDPARPVIMIGPGTGLAPFRGFIGERRALKKAGRALGSALLYFGCRRADHDFLYRDELEAAEREGLVSLRVAFSRGEGERCYVQDLIRRDGPEIWRQLSAGAHVYVCGDGARMEPDVKRALQRICSDETDADADAAEAFIDALAREGRYALDVWAGG